MRYTFLMILFLLAAPGWSQINEVDTKIERDNSSTVLLFHFSYGYQLLGGDLDDRYGNSFSLAGNSEILTEKGNWIFGINGQFHFGNRVEEDVLSNLRNPDGFILGENGDFADIQLRRRGFYLGGYVGKLIGLSADNPRSGIRLTAGLGLLQHKVRLQEDPVSFVPQISNDYRKGYDRLSNGLALTQEFGYQLLSTNRLLNFYAGFEFMQGFTRNRRSFNFDIRQVDATDRFDLITTFKIAWTLPFYFAEPTEKIYY